VRAELQLQITAAIGRLESVITAMQAKSFALEQRVLAVEDAVSSTASAVQELGAAAAAQADRSYLLETRQTQHDAAEVIFFDRLAEVLQLLQSLPSLSRLQAGSQ
jgi:hypothetical protein